jgi:hypothetical protein
MEMEIDQPDNNLGSSFLANRRKRLDIYDSDEEYIEEIYPKKRSVDEEYIEEIYPKKRNKEIYREIELLTNNLIRFGIQPEKKTKAQWQKQVDLWTKRREMVALEEHLPDIFETVGRQRFNYESTLVVGTIRGSTRIAQMILGTSRVSHKTLSVVLYKAAERGNLKIVESTLIKMDESPPRNYPWNNLYIFALALLKGLKAGHRPVAEKIYPYLKHSDTIHRHIYYNAPLSLKDDLDLIFADSILASRVTSMMI